MLTYRILICLYLGSNWIAFACPFYGVSLNYFFFHPLQKAAEYPFDQFEEMLDKEKVEVLVVTTVDANHHEYISGSFLLSLRISSRHPPILYAPSFF